MFQAFNIVNSLVLCLFCAHFVFIVSDTWLEAVFFYSLEVLSIWIMCTLCTDPLNSLRSSAPHLCSVFGPHSFFFETLLLLESFFIDHFISSLLIQDRLKNAAIVSVWMGESINSYSETPTLRALEGNIQTSSY